MDFCRSVLIGSWLRKESILVSSGDSPSGILAAAGHMTWGAMNESLETFQRWFWVSLVLFFLYGWLLVFRIRWRESWLRYTAAESAFWSRLGLPKSRGVGAAVRGKPCGDGLPVDHCHPFRAVDVSECRRLPLFQAPNGGQTAIEDGLDGSSACLAGKTALVSREDPAGKPQMDAAEPSAAKPQPQGAWRSRRFRVRTSCNQR